MNEIVAWFKEITPGGVGIWTAVGLIVVALIRQGPINRKLTQEREGNLLAERAKDMAAMRKRIAELEAEQKVDRHTINNLEHIIESFLDWVEMYPDRSAEWLAKARTKMTESKLQRATEKAGVYAGSISGAAVEDGGPTT